MNPYVPYSPIFERRPIEWPGGARVAVWLAVNVEHYEYLPRPNPYRRPWPRVPVPDVMEYAARDYGNRVGFWRLLDVLDRYEIPVTASANLGALELHPEVTAAIAERGWTMMGHGFFHTRDVVDIDRDAEREQLDDWLATTLRLTGKQVKGAQAAGAMTANSLELMVEAGFTYSCDFFCDDEPFPVVVGNGRLVGVPYELDLNDSMLMRRGTGRWEDEEFTATCKRHFDHLYAEGAEGGKVMSIPLHPFVVGRPEKVGYIAELLDHILGHDGVWMTDPEAIAEHYLEHDFEVAIAESKSVEPRGSGVAVDPRAAPPKRAEPEFEPTVTAPFLQWSPLPARPPLVWPGGARVAVCPVVSIEHLEWGRAEGGPTPTPFGTIGSRSRAGIHDVSFFDYGTRVGVFRVMRVLDRLGIRATAAMDALLAAETPYLVEACLDRGWELAGHGLSCNRLLSDELDADGERGQIALSLELLERATGQRPSGWVSADYGESSRTIPLLIEHGLRYVCDWPNDDQPYSLSTAEGEIVSLPVSIELDDVFTHRGGLIPIGRWEDMVRRNFDELYAEAGASGRLLVLNLHPYVIGHPSRIGALERAIGHIAGHDQVWMATGSEIADWWLSQRSE